MTPTHPALRAALSAGFRDPREAAVEIEKIVAEWRRKVKEMGR